MPNKRRTKAGIQKNNEKIANENERNPNDKINRKGTNNEKTQEISRKTRKTHRKIKLIKKENRTKPIDLKLRET